VSGRIATVVYTAAGFCADMEEGRELGAPFCCRLRWSIEEMCLSPGQAGMRGVRFNARGEPWVPCGVFHFPTLSVIELEQRANRWWRLCR
jgi:hypothetical protein